MIFRKRRVLCRIFKIGNHRVEKFCIGDTREIHVPCVLFLYDKIFYREFTIATPRRSSVGSCHGCCPSTLRASMS